MVYKQLFSPGRIGALDIKNRVVVTPVGLPYAESNGEAGDNLSAYLEERARGGAGIVMPGIVLIDSKTGKLNPNELVLENRAQAMSFARLANRIHKYDARIFLQLYHPGKCTAAANLGGRLPWSASPVRTSGGETAKEMTREDIRYLIGRYVNAARLAKSAGVDGVEIHAAHGYLLGQFLTPTVNRRTDEYGGSLENRMRLVLEVYDAVRGEVGGDFVVGIRMSADEFVPGGNTLQEGVEMAKAYSARGMDYINVNCGLQESSQFNREPPSFQQGWKKYLAKAVREAVTCPVIAVNTVKRPDFAESLLKEGVSDFVGLSRGHLADPHWTQKVCQGREREIRTCISCLNCMDTFLKGVPPTCTVNPALGREREFAQLNRDGRGRAVAVVGGGPGGMEAARILAERDFHVTLFEKEDVLGGQLNYAEKPPAKEKITWLKEGLIAQVLSAGVQVELRREVTAGELEELGFEGVFVCTGSVPLRPRSIPGIDGEAVFTLPQVLTGRVVLDGRRVSVIGSGLAGLETAAFLGSRGCQVTVVEMRPEIGAGVFSQVLDDLLKELAPYQVQILPGHRLERIDPGRIELSRGDGSRVCVQNDAVVLSMGVTPRRSLTEEIQKRFRKVVLVGDARREGRILEALSDGFTKAWIYE